MYSSLCRNTIFPRRDCIDSLKFKFRMKLQCIFLPWKASSVPLLKFVVPAVKVDVEDDNRSGGQPSHQKLLIVRESERAYTGLTTREGVEQAQVESSPHLYYTLLPSCHHILPVSWNQNAIDPVGVHLASEELAVDGVEREVVGGVARHHYPLPRQPQAAGTVQVRRSRQW